MISSTLLGDLFQLLLTSFSIQAGGPVQPFHLGARPLGRSDDFTGFPNGYDLQIAMDILEPNQTISLSSPRRCPLADVRWPPT